jgi:hypothetical protein
VNVTVPEEGKAPPAVVVTEAGTVVRGDPSHVNVTVFEAAKFVPVTVTTAPFTPEIGVSTIAGAMLVKIATAALPLESVAVTLWGPLAEAGTAKVIPEKEPPALVVTEGGTVVRTTASNLNVMPEVGAKFAPVTVTTVPTGPSTGLMVIAGTATVNRAVAVFELASVALTVWGPAIAAGTVNVTVPEEGKAPPAVVVTEAGTVVRAAPSKVKVISLLAANWIPLIVTVVPISPTSGLMVIAGSGLVEEVVTSKIAVALSPARSVPVTVLNPVAALPGTAKEQGDPMLPAASVPQDPQLDPWKVRLTVELGVKLVPVMSTAVSTGPLLGLRARVGAVTVNTALAAFALASVA